MSFIPAGIGADLRALVTTSLPDSCTNSRTGETHPCRIAPQTRMERLSQLPHYLRLPTFRLTQSDGIAVHSGDSITITDGTTLALKGIYTVLEVLLPRSYSVATVATLLLVRRPDGTLALLNTATVSFRQKSPRAGHSQSDVISAVAVMVDYLDPQAVENQGGATYTMAVTWDSALTFPDGQTPKEGDFLLWSGVNNGIAALRWARPLVILPAMTAYLEGTPA